MDERPVKCVPRMRTAPKIVAEIKAMDPGSEVSEHYVRQLAKDGKVPVVCCWPVYRRYRRYPA